MIKEGIAILTQWLLLPILLNVLVFGIIPYDHSISYKDITSDSGNGTVSGHVWAVSLIPWCLIMSTASALSLEIYSKTISEIDFGVVIWEDTPHDYLIIAITSVIAAMVAQCLIFGLATSGQIRSWLAMLMAGSMGAFAVMLLKFLRSKRSMHESDKRFRPEEAKEVFILLTVGLFILFPIACVVYTVCLHSITIWVGEL